MATYIGTFSGRTSYDLRVHITLHSTDAANNRSRYTVSTDAISNAGGGSFRGDPMYAVVYVNGVRYQTSRSNLDFRPDSAGKVLAIGSFTTGWITHNSDGRKTFAVRVFSAATSGATSPQALGVFGTADSGNNNFVAARIPKAPGKPATPVLGAVSTTSIAYAIGAPPDNGGAAISTYNHQAATDAGFSSIARAWNSAAANQLASPLAPGTQHWIRYRAVNSVGPGPWSDPVDATTLPAVPPGMTVTPSLGGGSASVALSPPSGVSTVDSYRVERRPLSGSPVSVYDSPTSPISATGLTPGAVYEWRSSAFIGAYQTPWTAWVPIVQPNPNTNPGDYFDGSTADTDDVDFRWVGATNNSTSRAVGRRPLGWGLLDAGLPVPAGAQTLARVTGGRSGTFAARWTAVAPAFAAWPGTSADLGELSEVAEGGVYFASLYVWPEAAGLEGAGAIVWYDGAGVQIGAPAVAASSTPLPENAWTRIVLEAQAPPTAEYAAFGVRLTDAANVAIPSGTSVILDDAMLAIGALYPWFSGDSPATSAWSYSWEGAPNESVSIATALAPEDFDPLADPDCDPIPSPPSPPPIVDDCIELVGSWRRYWAIVPAEEVSQWLDLLPTLEITTGALAARQVRIRVYPNPDDLPPASFVADEWSAEQIVSYIPAQTVVTLDGVAQRAWAEVNGADPIAADRLLYGTGGGPASWPILSCGTGYLVSFDVPLDAPEGNLSIAVSLTTRMM